MDTIRILHIENTAGVAHGIATGQRRLGHDADVLETWRSPLHYEHEHESYYEGSYLNKLLRMRDSIRIAKEYDVIHAHSGIARSRLDYIYMARVLKKPLFVHYHGSESRLGYGLHHQGIITGKFVATPDLLRYHPKALFVPNPISADLQPCDNPLPVIVHMPTDRARKGTEIIFRAVQRLASRHDFVFKLIEGKTHSEAMAALASADILIDQISPTIDGRPAGAFGMCSLEAMSMGKVAVSHYDNEVAKHYPGDLPIVNSRPSIDGLVDALDGLLADKSYRDRLSRYSIDYVRDHLSPVHIAQQISAVYRCHGVI